MRTAVVVVVIAGLAALWALGLVPAAIFVVCAAPAIAFRAVDGNR